MGAIAGSVGPIASTGNGESLRITLVNLPWQVVTWPSMAMSVLDTALTDLGHDVTQLYENVSFAEHCLAVTDGAISPDDYYAVCDDGYPYGVGEWIFSSALYHPGWRIDEFRAHLTLGGYPAIDEAVQMHHLAPEYTRLAAERVLASEPELVGLTSSFEQNVPSLALARQLKRLRPDLPVVMGGANCDDVMGAALHRNFSWLDFVVRGEGERPVAELMEALAGNRRLAEVTSLCWRDPSGRSVENPYVAVMTPGPHLPAAQVRPFFSTVEASAVRPWIDILYLRLETSRGCWWGEKRQCTFCGLNSGSIGFRSKPAERAWEEIASAVTEHGILDITLTDNILDPAYFDTLLPRLAASGWDLRIFYEVKSNLKPDQLELLAAAGVSVVQPGIESLASGPLALMDKGATGAGQVRALRLFREHGIFPAWNYLFGFPGEDWTRDYEHVLAQLPALVHLPPPGNVGRLTLDRFSPLFRGELGIDESRRPAAWYHIVYDLPERELFDLAYLFSYRPRGISDDVGGLLRAAVDAWRTGYETSSLTYRAVDASVVVTDRRVGWPHRDHILRGEEAAVYLTLSRHLAVPALRAALQAGGYDLPDDRLAQLLARWRDGGLVYSDNDVWVALAIEADPRLRTNWQETHDLVAV